MFAMVLQEKIGIGMDQLGWECNVLERGNGWMEGGCLAFSENNFLLQTKRMTEVSNALEGTTIITGWCLSGQKNGKGWRRRLVMFFTPIALPDVTRLKCKHTIHWLLCLQPQKLAALATKRRRH